VYWVEDYLQPQSNSTQNTWFKMGILDVKQLTVLKKYKGFIYGIAYGLIARGIFAFEFSNSIFRTQGLMTLSFLFLVPLAIGLIVAYHHDTVTSSRKIVVLIMPLSAILGLIAITVILGYEGIICALMAIPIFALMALIGGYIGVRIFYRQKDKFSISVLILIPFLMAPIEAYFGLSEKVFTEHTSILINANEDNVWRNITRVKAITDEENNISLFQVMGFPRPIEAELDTVAVGGIRKAIFARGLFFTETVTQVVPHTVLAFNIEADPNSIPPKALDEHVMVGGKYFDVLEGRYEIEKVDDHLIKLHLTSRFRLSTNFNFYSGLWSKVIMRDIQKNILEIVKSRSESM
jgi:hypothetical protein